MKNSKTKKSEPAAERGGVETAEPAAERGGVEMAELAAEHCDLKNLAAQRIAIIDAGIKEMEKFLSEAPEGCVEVTTRGSNTYYRYSQSKGAEKLRKYLSPEIAEHKDLLNTMFEKTFFKKMLPIARKELKALETFQKNYEPEEKFDLYRDLDDTKKCFVRKMFHTDEEIKTCSDKKMAEEIEKRFERWNKSYAEYQNNYKTEELSIETIDGHFVRSKSERMIADELARAGIPYKYEMKFTSRGSVLYPDFVIFDKRNSRIYIWEHFGMMDNPRYVNRECLAKIDIYAVEGYVLGHNLFATFESSERPLQVSHVLNTIARIKEIK